MTTLLEFLRTNVVGFMARRDNPNQVTAAQAGGYNKSDTDDKISTRLPVGLLPIYAYGSSDNTAIGKSTSGFNLTITDDQPLLIYGTPYTIAKATVSAAAFPNTTSYLTAELVGGVPTYKLYAAKPSDTNTRINIGTITTSATAITASTITKARGVIAASAPQ
jgi:hypothetical protein